MRAPYTRIRRGFRNFRGILNSISGCVDPPGLAGQHINCEAAITTCPPGSPRPDHLDSVRAYRSSSSSPPCARGALAPSECHTPQQAGQWRSNGAMCGAQRASQFSPCARLHESLSAHRRGCGTAAVLRSEYRGRLAPKLPAGTDPGSGEDRLPSPFAVALTYFLARASGSCTRPSCRQSRSCERRTRSRCSTRGSFALLGSIVTRSLFPCLRAPGSRCG